MKKFFGKLFINLFVLTLITGSSDVVTVLADDILPEDALENTESITLPDIEDLSGEAEEETDRKDTRTVGGSIPVDLGYDVPIVGAGNGVDYTGEDLTDGSNLPRKYNVFEKGQLPTVRDQGNYGTCWSFAVIGAIESDMIHDGKAGKDIDLSELHLAYFLFHNYKDPAGCRTDSISEHSDPKKYLMLGANSVLAFRTLSNMVGAVDERDAAYSLIPSYSPADEDSVSKDSVQVRNVYIINPKDREGIKSAIMEHGGVSTAYYEDINDGGKSYNEEHKAYCNTDATKTNHDVMIVGWDDDFPVENFNASSRPKENGAWLFRNSWGVDAYDHDGYFWVSYEDRSFGIEDVNCFAFDGSRELYDNCYSYSGQVITSEIYSISPGSILTTTYRVKGGQTIKAVGFETGGSNVSVEVAAMNLKTRETVSETVNTSFAGFYTAELPDLYVPTDADIAVSLKVSNEDGSMIPIPFESVGQTELGGQFVFTGVCDRGCYIYDAATDKDLYINNDLRSQLFTKNSGEVLPENAVLSQTEYSGHAKETATITFAEGSTVKNPSYVKWTSSDTGCATVDENGIITFGSKKGFSEITGTYTGNGGATVTVKCTAVVEPYNVTYHVPGDIVTKDLPGKYDTAAGTITGSFYPGDKTGEGLFCAKKPNGNKVAAWYKSPVLEEKSRVDWHPDEEGDLELWPEWATPDETDLKIYNITMSDDGHGTASAAKKSGKTGTVITIKANPSNDYVFKNWTVVSGSASIGDKSKATTTLTIKHSDVKVKAVFEKKVSIKNAKITLSGSSFKYNGKKRKPSVKSVTLNGKKLKSGTDYSVTWSDKSSKNPGKYTVTVTGKGKYKGSKKVSYKIVKADNPLTVKLKNKVLTVPQSVLKNNSLTIKRSLYLGVSKNKGAVTYKKVKGSKYISIDKKTGNIRLPKNMKKNMYKITVSVKAAGNKYYKASKEKKKTFTIIVK